MTRQPIVKIVQNCYHTTCPDRYFPRAHTRERPQMPFELVAYPLLLHEIQDSHLTAIAIRIFQVLLSMTMTDLTIDPQLRLQPPTQPPRDASSLSTLSTRTEGGTPDAQSEGEEEGGGTTRKRQKLNLYKCNQCRVARKKVFAFHHLVLILLRGPVFSDWSRMAK